MWHQRACAVNRPNGLLTTHNCRLNNTKEEDRIQISLHHCCSFNRVALVVGVFAILLTFFHFILPDIVAYVQQSNFHASVSVSSLSSTYDPINSRAKININALADFVFMFAVGSARSAAFHASQMMKRIRFQFSCTLSIEKSQRSHTLRHLRTTWSQPNRTHLMVCLYCDLIMIPFKFERHSISIGSKENPWLVLIHLTTWHCFYCHDQMNYK